MMREHLVTAGGLATRVLEEGSGPVALLLHGGALGCSAEDWSPLFAPVAAAGFRALAIDQPGFGACDDPPDVSVAFRAGFIRGVLDALGIDRALWVGHSQAGRYVVGTALEAPDRMLAGVVLCTGSDARAPVTYVYGADDGGQVRERIALARERYPQLPFHVIERCGHFAQWDQPATVVEFIRDAARRPA